MKRKELFEFEDSRHLPKFVRNSLTGLIKVLHKMMGTSEVIADLIAEINKDFSFNRIIDLGSGSGGPMVEVSKILKQDLNTAHISILLSDLYPNKEVIEKFKLDTIIGVDYNETAIDATDFSSMPIGLKTMIASFHHLSPKQAKNVLQSAQTHKQPILIYEIAKNKIPFIIWLLLLPISLVILFIMTWLMSPFVRPFTFKQFVFTYIIPIIPIVYAWDGQASLIRTYTFNDIKSLFPKQQKNYKWILEDAYKTNNKKQGYYIIGLPLT